MAFCGGGAQEGVERLSRPAVIDGCKTGGRELSEQLDLGRGAAQGLVAIGTRLQDGGCGKGSEEDGEKDRDGEPQPGIGALEATERRVGSCPGNAQYAPTARSCARRLRACHAQTPPRIPDRLVRETCRIYPNH